MHTTEILNATDMITPRPAAAFVAWANEKSNALAATPQTKRYARSGDVLAQKFAHEIYFLARFVERDFVHIPGVVITPNLNSDNFDATIAFSGSRPKVFVEITRAIDGYDLSLRLEVLDRDGIVSLTGPITRTGKKGTPKRVVKVEMEMADRDEQLAKHLTLVESAVKAKAGRQYGKNFILLLIVDDYQGFPDDSDHTKLDAMLRTKLLSVDLDFSQLIILGISGKLQLSYRLPKYNCDNATL